MERRRAAAGPEILIVARVPNQGEDAPVQVEFEVVVVAGVDGVSTRRASFGRASGRLPMVAFGAEYFEGFVDPFGGDHDIGVAHQTEAGVAIAGLEQGRAP